MGNRLINNNASMWSEAKSKLSVPFRAEWEGFFSFGIDTITSIRNLIRGKAALSVVGNPEYGPNYIELTGAQVAYLVTAINNTPDMTIIATAMPLNDAGSAIASNYQSSRADGAGLCIGTQLGFNYGASPSDGNVITSFNHATLINNVSSSAEAKTSIESPINKWYLVSGRVKNDNRTRRVDNITAHTSGVNSPLVNPADLGDVMRIGSSYNNQFPGKIRLCEIAIFSEYLSDANYSSIIQFMRASAAEKGIVV